MARAYIRYSCNGEKYISTGAGVEDCMKAMEEIRKDIAAKKRYIGRLSSHHLKVGDTWTFELFRRNKQRPRIPRETITVVIDQAMGGPRKFFL